jgi:lamin tail-like protein
MGAVPGTADAGGSESPVDGGVTDRIGPRDPDAGATDATPRDGGQTGPGGRSDGLGAARGSGGGSGSGSGKAGAAGDVAMGDAGGPGGAPADNGSGGATTGGGSGGQAPRPVAGDLAITELLINPTGTDTGREWIEIVNRVAHPVDLADVHVGDALNEAPLDFAILAGAPPLLTAGARAVLIQSADATKNGGVTIGGGGLVPVGGAFGTRVSLNNEGDTISLCAGPCAEGVVLDRVAWDAALGVAYEGHALSIDEAGRRCPASSGFGDASSFGTPGAPNPSCP